MPEAAVGGNNRFPSLQSIADLFRSSINDDMAGATQTPGEGNIATNVSPFLLSFMNSAIRDMYSDLRNIGDPSLVLDNYLLLGIPPLAAPDPTVQVSLDFIGYFNGYTWNPNFKLPFSCTRVEKVWERPSGSNGDFRLMTALPSGLPGVNQVDRMQYWETRQGAVWMPGCLLATDIRLRARISFPDFLNPQTLNFQTAYVPVLDCTNAIVAKMLRLYGRRFAPDLYPMAVADEKEYMDKLRQEVVRQMQSAENERPEFGSF